MTCGRNLVERVARAHVHDVERHVAGHVAEHDGAVRGLGLERRGPCVAVELGVGVAACDGLLHEHVDGRPVLGVHHDHGAALACRLHGAQDLAVVAVEHARVGHEQLEARDALVHQLVHRLERVVVDPADDLVERVVDGALALGLRVPRRETVLHALAGPLHGEVDDRRRAAERSCPRSGLEGVARERAAERQLHVGVAVDPARHDVLPGGVDHAIGTGREVGAERRVAGGHQRDDLLAVDEHVHRLRGHGGDDEAAPDQRGHGCTRSP